MATRTYRSALLLTSAAISLTGAAGTAFAQTATPTPAPAPAPEPTAAPTPAPVPKTTTQRPMAPLAGDILGSRGMIRTFFGDIAPYYRPGSGYWGETDPLGGDVTAFWGTLQPHRGMIRTFEGEIDGMRGMIRTFEGDIEENRGMIRTFWGDIGETRGMIRTFWDGIDSPDDYSQLAVHLKEFVGQSEDFWAGAVQEATGKTFAEGFANPLLAKYGIDLSDPTSLSRLDQTQRELFFLAWYDGLMQFSGADHVDHWMKQVSWTPKLTQVQGSGTQAVIGLVDFWAANDPDVAPKLIYSGGYNIDTNNHGAGVVSLIVGSHDGKGVMGIAPNARVAAFNPFDSTHTASWDDVKRGIIEVTKRGASVVNLSLGVPGHTLHSEWRNVFKTSEISSVKDKTLYVIAAGNTGTTQTQNIEMNGALDSTFIVVGSVGPTGQISDFSNRPGTACLTDGGSCKNTAVWNGQGKFEKTDYLKESGLLMNRFLVAPGEMILVSDGQGGVTRMSGTSFAAPLVSGAIALIHDRWPWLKAYPRDVAKAILESATDLGAPGPDPVYGMGMLNVEAAQSALDFDALKYYLYDGTSKKEYSAKTLQRTGMQAAWTAKNMYFVAFEKLDKAERDFLIPLSDRLVGTTRNGEYFQEFVYNRFVAWMNGAPFASSAPHGLGFSDLNSYSQTGGNYGGWSFRMAGRMTGVTPTSYDPRMTSSVSMIAPSGKFALSFGSGDGAVFLGGTGSMQMTSDFDAQSGGVNPLLGFASGGMHVGSRVELTPGLDLSVGVTQRRKDRTRDDLRDYALARDRALVSGLQAYDASAANVRLDYRAANWMSLSASITQLGEKDALLGVQSLDANDMAGGTFTHGVTLGADIKLGGGVNLFASATGARSMSKGSPLMRIGKAGILGTAFQAGVGKERLLGKTDRLRLSIAQPLTIERGTIMMDMVKVVDRETGEIGTVTEAFDIGAPEKRRYVVEALYGASAMGGRAEFSLFGRGELRKTDAQTPRLMVGGQARLAF